MSYPFNGNCPTNPLVAIKNITLHNLKSQGGYSSPGVIRCNASSPCTDINLNNVDMQGLWKQFNMTFITEYVDGNVESVTFDPNFGSQNERVFELITVDHVITFLASFLGFYKADRTQIVAWETTAGLALWAVTQLLV